MSSLTIDLPKDDAERLAELARRQGATPEAIAREAVRAKLDEESSWDTEVRAGIAEIDCGQSMTLADFEREMDEFVASLPARG